MVNAVQRPPVLACSTLLCLTIYFAEKTQRADKRKRQGGGVEDGMDVDSSRDCSGVSEKRVFFVLKT